MEIIVANVDKVTFDIEVQLEEQVGAQMLPFPGMDNACHNKECPFLHINPDMKMDCPWYDRGFCHHGPQCRSRHVRRVLCMNYFSGFCPDGPNCKFMQPRFELPQVMDDKQMPHKKQSITCHYCEEMGHKASQCFKANPKLREQNAIIVMRTFLLMVSLVSLLKVRPFS